MKWTTIASGVGKHGVHVTDAGTQSLTAGDPGTVVDFDTEREDTDAYHDTATNNSRLTVPSTALAGVYIIGAQIGWNLINTNAHYHVSIRLNGSTILGQTWFNENGSDNEKPRGVVTIVARLANGDYVECIAANNDNTTTSQKTNQAFPEFYMWKIAD